MKNTPHAPTDPADDPGSLAPYLDARIFRALGDETRLAVLARLAMNPGSQTVTEVAACCGVHLSGVSRHLRLLHEAGLVAVERSGREVRYRLCCGDLTAMLRQLADALDGCAAGCCGADQENDS